MGNDNLDRRDDEARVRREGRLPPGQSLTNKFPVLHYGPVPRFRPETWDFRVWGEVEEEKRWTWAEFQGLPRTRLRMDIHCVTRWSKFDTDWEGVGLRTLVESGLIVYEYAKILQRELLAAKDVKRIVLYGVQNEAIFIKMRREKMAQLGISPQDISVEAEIEEHCHQFR